MTHTPENLDWYCGPRGCYKLGLADNFGLDVAFSDHLDIDQNRMAVTIPYADGNRRDGVGDLLEVSGIKLDRHRKNPIHLFDHGKIVQLPIGMVEEPQTGQYTGVIDVEHNMAKDLVFFYQGKGINGVEKTKERDHALFCEQIFHLLSERFLRGGSIGYQNLRVKHLPADYERGTPAGLHLLSVLKLESSTVVMPANQDTVRKVLALPKCCGKSLSPYLVKSLEPYMGQKKVQMGFEGTVAIPHGDLSRTKIPPPKMKPGWVQVVKELRKKYRGMEKGVGGAVIGGITGTLAGGGSPIGTAIGAGMGHVIQEAIGKVNLSRSVKPVRTSKPPKTKSQCGCKECSVGKKCGCGTKSINVRYRNKVVKGFASVELKFHTLGMSVKQQNAFLKDMHSAGFGKPSQGKYLKQDPPRLAFPIKMMTFTFDIAPQSKDMDEDSLTKAIGTASAIGRRHGAKFLGNSGKSLEKSMSDNKHVKGNTKAIPPEEKEDTEEETPVEPESEAAPDLEEGIPEGEESVSEDENGEEEDKDLDDSWEWGEEPFGSQTLRKMHHDAGTLMGEYDGYHKLLDHEHVKKHLADHLKGLDKFMSLTEDLHKRHYKELPPIGGVDDKELPDDAVPADSGGEDEPPPEDEEIPEDEVSDEAEEETEEEEPEAEANEKSLTNVRLKYRGHQHNAVLTSQNRPVMKKPVDSSKGPQKPGGNKPQKSVCPKCGKADCTCPKEKANGQPSPNPRPAPKQPDLSWDKQESQTPKTDIRAANQATMDRIRRTGKDLTDEEKEEVEGELEEVQENLDEAEENTEGEKSLLKPHHKVSVGEARDFLNDLSNANEFGDEQRHLSFYHHKTLEKMCKDYDDGSGEGDVEGFKAAKPMSHQSRTAEVVDRPELVRGRSTVIGTGRPVGNYPQKPGGNKPQKDLDADGTKADAPTRISGAKPTAPPPEPRQRISQAHQAARDRPESAQSREVSKHPNVRAIAEHLAGASKFFKELSDTHDFGMKHQKSSSNWHKKLSSLLDEDTADEEDFGEEEETGEMGEKELHELNLEQSKQLDILNQKILELSGKF